jgi:glycosyltransferase involved in cell wall biosynthesis
MADTPMRVVIDARYLDGTFSGIATYSRDLLEHLSRVDTETQYTVLVQRGFRSRMELGPNFTVRSYDAAPVSTGTLFKLGSALEDMQPDLVHSLFPIVPLSMDIPQIVTVHDLQPFIDPDFSGRRPRLLRWAYNRFYRWVYPAAFHRAKWILCVSHSTRDDLAELMPSITPKLVVVHSGLDRAKLNIPSDEAVKKVREKYELQGPYAIYFGSTRPNKNLANMVKGFSKVLRRDDPTLSNMTFVMAVKPDRFFRSVERTIQVRGLTGRVKILPQVDEETKRALLAGSHAMFFATKYEGFGFPALEAMSYGVPVLAGASGALPETCGDAAVLVDPHDTDSIADGMHAILTDENLRLKLKEHGPRQAAKFDWNYTAEVVRDIYRLLV